MLEVLKLLPLVFISLLLGALSSYIILELFQNRLPKTLSIKELALKAISSQPNPFVYFYEANYLNFGLASFIDFTKPILVYFICFLAIKDVATLNYLIALIPLGIALNLKLKSRVDLNPNVFSFLGFCFMLSPLLCLGLIVIFAGLIYFKVREPNIVLSVLFLAPFLGLLFNLNPQGLSLLLVILGIFIYRYFTYILKLARVIKK